MVDGTHVLFYQKCTCYIYINMLEEPTMFVTTMQCAMYKHFMYHVCYTQLTF